MRIALLIYGRLGYPSTHYDNTLDSIGREHTVDIFMSSDNPPEHFLKDFLAVYKPLRYVSDEIFYTIDLDKYRPRKGYNVNMSNMIRHFINKKRVYTLLEEYIEATGTHYDVVISLRQDLRFSNSFKFDHISENTLCVPGGNDSGDSRNHLNDQVAYGNLTVMKKYMTMFDNLIPILEGDVDLFPGPELLVHANTLFHKMSFVRTDLNYGRVRYE